VVGDLLPRIWAANEPNMVRPDGRVATFSIAIFRPVLRLVAWADRGGQNDRHPRAGFVDADARERLSGVFSLHEMTVAEVMTPRMDVVSVDLSSTRDGVADTFRRAEHSRLLVVDGDPDNVVGALYAKDLLNDMAAQPQGPDWHHLVRPVEYVPDAKRLDRQLRDFQLGQAHLVVVADEFGGTSGIVTLEDVLEQIVGEIQDEYDTEEVAPMQRNADGALVVLGNVPLHDLESELDGGFGREDVDTVGGLVLAIAGRVPRVGETFTVDEFAITIDQIARRRVGRVTIRRLAPVVRSPGIHEAGE
jgi:magnesium and cobalt transporter